MMGRVADSRTLDLVYRIRDARGEWCWFHDRSMRRQALNDETIIEGISRISPID